MSAHVDGVKKQINGLNKEEKLRLAKAAVALLIFWTLDVASDLNMYEKVGPRSNRHPPRPRSLIAHPSPHLPSSLYGTLLQWTSTISIMVPWLWSDQCH